MTNPIRNVQFHNGICLKWIQDGPVPYMAADSIAAAMETDLETIVRDVDVYYVNNTPAVEFDDLWSYVEAFDPELFVALFE